MEQVVERKAEYSAWLMEEVEETFGRSVISSRDCIQLSEEILQKVSFRINPNTLRRFFGLVKADYPPSTSTLNILSRFCGFDSLDDLLASKKRKETPQLTHANEKGILDYLTTLFRNTDVREANDEIFLSLVKQTVNFILVHPELADKFQRAVAKTKNGQEYYFEQFVNIDKLNGFYGDGVRYYLNEKKTSEAQVWGNALLSLRAWLSNDAPALQRHYDEIRKIKGVREFHPFVCGRTFAAHLYYADMNNVDTERILIDAQHVHSQIKPVKENYGLFPCFEYSFSNALALTGHCEEALYYLKYAKKNYKSKHAYVDAGLYLTMDLMEAYCLANTGEIEAAETIYDNIRPSQFNFLTKKTDTIIYLLLGVKLKRNASKYQDSLHELIRQTGFVKLLPY